MKTVFSTNALEPKQNEILVTIASRASKDSAGNEKPAAHKPYYGVFEVPEQIAAQQDELVKLAALAGLSAAYTKFAKSKLPTKLLASAAGAEQQIACSLDDLRAALASEASEARRITKEVINEAWKAVAASALHKLCTLKGVASESQLPDNVRRQFSAQMLKRKDFALSFASTTGAKLHSEEALNSGLLWIVALVEAEPENWIWSSILEKITTEVQRREDERNAAAELADDEADLDLTALF